ncbi:hypothetical protein CPC16_000941 [Podila verticillata]|nr:hypothetical protein CPC16_000941 [Podila verticillata]
MLKIICAIDGEREPFHVDINDSDSSSDLKNKVKLARPSCLRQDANILSLYKAPEGVGINTEPGVTVGMEDEISATSSLRGMFAETNTVQVIVRPRRYNRSPLNIAQYNSRSRDLVWKEDTRTLSEAFLSMLFRTPIEPTCSCLYGLAINEHVKKERVDPRRYFFLLLDFSAVIRSQDREKAEHNLNLMLNESIKQFYGTYEPYLRISADYLIENYIQDSAAASLTAGVNVVHDLLASVDSPEDLLSMIKGIYVMADEYDSYSKEYLIPIDSVQWKPPQRADADSVLKGFWASVKTGLGNRKIAKCCITGVSPQSSVNNTSGFNVAQYVSWEPELATFCGLTEADVAAALAIKKVCEFTAKAEKHLRIMRDHCNGFNLIPGGQGPLTYNTDTFFKYLQRLAMGKPMENPLSVTNSEASEVSLRLLAASPVATRLLEDGLFSGSEQGKNVEERTIPFGDIGQTFTLANLAGELAKSKAAWLSCMVYLGGLAFCVGKKALRIPNLVAAERFGSAILHRHQATLEDEHDVGTHNIKKKEEDHCNSIRFTLLANIHPSLRKIGVETTITKPLGTLGRIDMLVSVPSRKQLFVLEWKSIQIDYIKIGSGSHLKRANALADIHDASGVLDLKFRNGKFRAGQTIKEWILNESKDGKGHSPQQQLSDYVQSQEIKK